MNLATYLVQGSSLTKGSQKKWLAQMAQMPLSQAIAQAAKGLMLHFLLHAGGARETRIHWQGEERACRLWELPSDPQLHLSQRCSHILQCLQDAFHRDQKLRLPPPEPGQGDIFFYHALYVHLAERDDVPRFTTALRRASPLTRLCHCPIIGNHTSLTFTDGQEGEPSITIEEANQLVRHPITRFLSAYLAEEWAQLPPPASHQDPDSQVARINAKRATLQLYLQACEQQHKWSLMTSFPLFFRRLEQAHFDRQASQVIGFSKWRLAAREMVLAAYAGLLDLGVSFEQLYQRDIVQPGTYGWQAPEEIRIFVQTFGRLWASGGLSARIQDTQQHLRAQMG